MLEAQILRDLGNVCRLVWIDGGSATNLNGTEAAASRTRVSENHECRSLLAPTFGQVWTACAFTNSVQVFLPHHAFNLFDRIRSWHADGQPLGQPLSHVQL